MPREEVGYDQRVREEFAISRGGLRAMLVMAVGLVVVYVTAAVLLFL